MTDDVYYVISVTYYVICGSFDRIGISCARIGCVYDMTAGICAMLSVALYVTGVCLKCQAMHIVNVTVHII